MAPKGGQPVVIRSIPQNKKVNRIRLLGYGNVEFNPFEGVVTIKMPDSLPLEYVNTLEISF